MINIEPTVRDLTEKEVKSFSKYAATFYKELDLISKESEIESEQRRERSEKPATKTP